MEPGHAAAERALPVGVAFLSFLLFLSETTEPADGKRRYYHEVY